MAYSETTNYDLRKPAATDPVNIDILNWNMDKIDTQMKTNNNAAIQAASSSQAGRMSAADYIKLNKQEIPANANLNNYTTDGLFYRCNYDSIAASLTNCPTSVQFTMTVVNAASGTLIQTIIDQGLTIYRRIKYINSGTWSEWHKWTNADESSVTFDSIRDANNTSGVTGSVYKKGKTVSIYFSATLSVALTAGTWKVIAQLPVGYRPAQGLSFMLSTTETNPSIARGYVSDNGNISIKTPISYSAGMDFAGSVTYFTS